MNKDGSIQQLCNGCYSPLRTGRLAKRIKVESAISSTPLARHRQYHFAGFTLDAGRGSLQRDGVDIKLRPKSFELLCFLLERHGRLVSKDEILSAIWCSTVVTDGVVVQCLIDIRRAIGDHSQRMIRTVPRRGYLFDVPVTEQGDLDAGASRRSAGRRVVGMRSGWLSIACVALIGVAGLAWHLASNSGDASTDGDFGSSVEQLSIAVLPFSDMSKGQDLGYFADGISEELLNVLSQVRELRVISRTSSFAFKGRKVDIATIKERLGVTHVLEGSVRQSDNRIRITAQLIDTSTSAHVWSESYDRSLDDIFAVQDEISAQVLNLLVTSLSVSAPKVRETDLRAYSYYLQGLQLTNQLDTSKTVQAQRLFEQSLEIDGTYAPAWRELARVLWRQIGEGSNLRDDIDRHLHALDRASEFAPDDAALLAYRAWNEADYKGHFEKAARMFEEALANEPAEENVIRVSLIFALAFGEPEDAVALGEFGIARNPLCYPCHAQLINAYLISNRLEEAEIAARTMLSLFGRGHFVLGNVLLLRGQPMNALAAFAKEQNHSPIYLSIYNAMAMHDLGHTEAATDVFDTIADDMGGEHLWRLAMAYSWMGYDDSALETIDKFAESMQMRDGGEILRLNQPRISMVSRDRRFGRLRDDPRWSDFLRKYGISPEQLADLQFTFASQLM